MAAVSPRRTLSLPHFVALMAAGVALAEAVHRECVKAQPRAPNRFACKPPQGIDLLTVHYDYIKMECNTSDEHGQPMELKVHFKDYKSTASLPTSNPNPSQKKWFDKTKMDGPTCSVYVYYLGPNLDTDPRVCAWRCYRVRAGQPDQELCIADATLDCSNATTKINSSSPSHGPDNASAVMLKIPTSAPSTLTTNFTPSTLTTNFTPSATSHTGSGSGNGSSDFGIIILLVVITLFVGGLLIILAIRDIKKRQLNRQHKHLSKPAQDGITASRLQPLSLNKSKGASAQQSGEDETPSKQKLIKIGSEGSNSDLSDDSDSASTGKTCTVPEMVVDPSTSVHYTTPITVVEDAVEIPTQDNMAAPTPLERNHPMSMQPAAENSAVNSVSSLLMSKYVLQYGKGFSRIDNLVGEKYSSLLAKGEPTSEARMSATSDDGRCIVYPHKTHTTQQPLQ